LEAVYLDEFRKRELQLPYEISTYFAWRLAKKIDQFTKPDL